MDGRHPHCAYCRKENRVLWLSSFTLCIRCKAAPHRPSSPYCFDCQRAMDVRKIGPRKVFVDRTNKTMCCKCKVNPRRKYHSYCQLCFNESQISRARKAGSWFNTLTADQRIKARARTRLNMEVKRGNVIRRPCEVCGNPDSEAHHYLGYDKENALKVRWLCKRHHDEAERILKSLLTKQPLLL